MSKKLSKDAYGGVHGKDYVPYISDKNNMGGNIVVLIIGILLAVLFAASTAYSGMKAGLTVAAGIPGAIVGAGLISVLAKQKGLLGTNLVQGMSSGGESVASGIIFVLPAVILIGGQISFAQGLAVGIAGVLVGIGVASIVHNYLIVEEHGKLMYPEAMAISETLVASSTGGEALKYMGMGFGIGGLVNLVTGSALGLVNNVISYVGEASYKWKFELEVNPLLLGIGFIVGLEVSLTMFAGSILANFAVNPLIGYFASMAQDSAVVWNDPSTAINAMEVGTISGAYGRYIGAGMMLCGGIIGAIQLIPVIIASLKATFGAKDAAGTDGKQQMFILLAGIILAFVGGFIISGGNIGMALLSTIVSLILMALFVIVAGRLTGTIGTSNLPVSGMTIASLVILTLIFVVMGWTDAAGSITNNVSLLLFGTLIVTAIAMAGGYLQSQKATYIVGGNKGEMQRYFTIAGLIGVVTVIGVIVALSGQLSDPEQFALPQANLMATLTSGIMSGNLPWIMIYAGVFLAIVCYFLKLPIMTVAIGFYLPIATTSIILVGALIKVLVENVVKDDAEREARVSNGISLSSGLVAGGSIIGLLGIILQVGGVIQLQELSGFVAGNGMAIILLIFLVVLTTLPILFGKLKK
ncbi:OPT/YSL family transporter [Erysipelotrichaceae bacterium OttesenSCG-928-M19]|nr:OPT/YSL family transporter [Erysipelotrichaceae bacterium OttesenSCG-928-M19]